MKRFVCCVMHLRMQLYCSGIFYCCSYLQCCSQFCLVSWHAISVLIHDKQPSFLLYWVNYFYNQEWVNSLFSLKQKLFLIQTSNLYSASNITRTWAALDFLARIHVLQAPSGTYSACWLPRSGSVFWQQLSCMMVECLP